MLYGRPLRRPGVAPARSGGARPRMSPRVRRRGRDFGCPRFVARVVRGVEVGPSPDWLRDRLDVDRPAPDQQRGRRDQLRPLGDGPAAPRLRPRRSWRGSEAPRAPARAGRDADHPRRRRARARSRRCWSSPTPSGPVGLAGVMGGLDSEVHGRDARRPDRGRPLRPPGGAHRRAQASACTPTPATASSAAPTPEPAHEAVSRAAHSSPRSPAARSSPARSTAGPPVDGQSTGLAAARPARARRGSTPSPAPRSRRPTSSAGSPASASAGAGRRSAGRSGTSPSPPGALTTSSRGRAAARVYEQDLYEEVLRIYGFDNIAAALPGIAGSDGPRDAASRSCASGCATGWRPAAMPRPSTSPSRAAAIDARLPEPAAGTRAAAARQPALGALRGDAPLAGPRTWSRAPASTSAAAPPAVRLFEIGHGLLPGDKLGALPDQPEHVGLVCGGRAGNPWQREVELDLFDLKGAVESLAEALGVRLEARPAEPARPARRERRRAVRPIAGRVVGFLGRVEEEEGYPLYVAEISLDGLDGRRREPRGRSCRRASRRSTPTSP